MIWVTLREMFGPDLKKLVGAIFIGPKQLTDIQLERLTVGNTTAEQKYVCCLLLRLPLLPADRIKPTFDDIHKQNTGKLLALKN